MSIGTTNAMKRCARAEHLINNPICGKNYNESSFSILRKCMNYLDVIKLEAILNKLYKPNFENKTILIKRFLYFFK